MIGEQLTKRDRYAHVVRNTKETQIDVSVWLDREGNSAQSISQYRRRLLTICRINKPPRRLHGDYR